MSTVNLAELIVTRLEEAAAANGGKLPPCSRCRGSGEVLVRLNRIGLGPAAAALLGVGCPTVRDADGRSLGQRMVCPACEGLRVRLPGTEGGGA